MEQEMKRDHNYETVSEALKDLNARGYAVDFQIHAEQECLLCDIKDIQLSPEEFFIDETYRFEGNTDPGDEMVIYAISSEKYGIKGTVVNAFGIYSDSNVSKIVERLKKRIL